MSYIDTAVVDSLKALDLERPIREADKHGHNWIVRFVANSGHSAWQILRCSNIKLTLGNQSALPIYPVSRPGSPGAASSFQSVCLEPAAVSAR